jgi:hypothetical protein
MAAGWRDKEMTMAEPKIFAHAGEGGWTATPDGNRRRVLLHTDELMMVEFGFDRVASVPCIRTRMSRQAMSRRAASR